MKLIFLGGPGAGKGTQAQKLAAQLNIPHISAGDMLRAEVMTGSALGQRASEYLMVGKLVPDSVIIRIMQKKLTDDNCANGFILDGFPRTIHQAEKLKEIIKIDTVVLIEVDVKILCKRYAGRRPCRDCNAVFHLDFNPPKDEKVCDTCGGELFKRPDDNPDTIRKRIEIFHNETEPLIDYYEKEKILKRVSGEGEIDEIYKEILNILEIE